MAPEYLNFLWWWQGLNGINDDIILKYTDPLSPPQVTQQSMSWIPLLNIKCHADTQVMEASDWLNTVNNGLSLVNTNSLLFSVILASDWLT